MRWAFFDFKKKKSIKVIWVWIFKIQFCVFCDESWFKSCQFLKGGILSCGLLKKAMNFALEKSSVKVKNENKPNQSWKLKNFYENVKSIGIIAFTEVGIDIQV